MGKNKKVTITEVANLAGVSIATVSHVINKTRYVKPELVNKIEKIIQETGYIEKVIEKENKLRIGRDSIIVVVLPNIESAVYRGIVKQLRNQICAQGYQFLVAITNDSINEEAQIIESLIKNKRIAGIIEVPLSDKVSDYKNLLDSQIPFVCVERSVLSENIDSVVFKDREAIYKGTDYLLECGHKNLLLLREKTESTTREERTKGYLEALTNHKINANNANTIDIDLKQAEDKCCLLMRKALKNVMPTAVIASGNRLTLYLLKALKEMGLECPSEISVIGFGDEAWSELMYPPLTTLERDVEGLGNLAANILFEKINTGKIITRERYANVELHVRKSTKMLDNGPYGEKAESPEGIILSKDEKKMLKLGRFRVAISLHYTGTAWAELHERGIRDEFERLGINVISVMDAHFDSQLQNAQLDGILLQHPDAVIAIPTDDKATAGKFQELSMVSKLVFISNVPEDIGKNSYVSCVSVNEWENGTNTGRLMGEYFKDRRSVKVGFINHGAMFYGTRARDSAAEKIITDNYANINIVSSRGFGQIENAYHVCKEMIASYPEIEALYVSWDQPALQVIRALKEFGRQDIAVFTTDLDYEIAKHIKTGIVKGLSTQRPYEQGKAAALVVAKSLVCDQVPKYVGVQPYVVEPKQLRRAWKDIFYETMPKELEK